MNQMATLAYRSEELVIEASNTRGNSFAFRDALWVTWPLSRFCSHFPQLPISRKKQLNYIFATADGLLDLNSHYRSSLSLIQSLLVILTTFPELPSPTTTKDSKPKTIAARPKPEEIQAAMTLLAVQPLLPGRNSEGSEAWEEVMTVEVGGW